LHGAVDPGARIGRTLLERRPVHIVDILEDEEYTSSATRRVSGFRTILGIPMISEERSSACSWSGVHESMGSAIARSSC
jgi:hypothetical protein